MIFKGVHTYTTQVSRMLLNLSYPQPRFSGCAFAHPQTSFDKKNIKYLSFHLNFFHILKNNYFFYLLAENQIKILNQSREYHILNRRVFVAILKNQPFRGVQMHTHKSQNLAENFHK